ncbi:MAG: FtsW/RodA/SpoVE family cell cycle protein [Oscillospiraceae bacterium]|nr:FtsW/RodA/SpoVE family cell cycle protein [Oscillospiraceae bacterium]
MNQALNHIWQYLKRLDYFLLLLCLAASAFSVLLLNTMYSNGVNLAVVSSRTWLMQLLSASVGILLALVLCGINYRFLSKIWYVAAGGGLTLSLLLFTPLGKRTGDAPDLNWLDLGIVEIQPSAFLRVVFILTFATHLNHIVKKGESISDIKHVLLLCLHGALPAALVFSQKDHGTTTILIGIFLIMLFTAGLSWKYIAAAVVASPLIAAFLWNYVAEPHHKMRIMILFDDELREAHMLDGFWQQWGGLAALNSGGMTGQGLTGGEYIHVYAIHNDFMFAYVGMTLGLVGCILTLAIIALICTRMLITANTAKDYLGRMICFGVFAMIFFEVVVNVGMVLGVTPVAGSQLPFISAGGSYTLALWLGTGLVLSVWAHRKKTRHMFYEEE